MAQHAPTATNPAQSANTMHTISVSSLEGGWGSKSHGVSFDSAIAPGPGHDPNT